MPNEIISMVNRLKFNKLIRYWFVSLKMQGVKKDVNLTY